LRRHDGASDQVRAHGGGERERKGHERARFTVEPDGVDAVVRRGTFGDRGRVARRSLGRHAPCFERVLK